MGRSEKLFTSEIFVAQKTHLEIFHEIAPPPPQAEKFRTEKVLQRE
jgi:hypothetical protein